MRYGFDTQGGFIAVDDDARVAAYAYPTSQHAGEAKRRAKGTATAMLTDARRPFGGELGAQITEALYLELSKNLSAIRASA